MQYVCIVYLSGSKRSDTGHHLLVELLFLPVKLFKQIKADNYLFYILLLFGYHT